MTNHEHGKHATSIVTSDTVRSSRDSHKVIMRSVAIVLLIVLIVSAWLIYKDFIRKPKTVSTTPTNSQSEATIQPEQAIINAQVEVNRAQTSQQKAKAYTDLGKAYLGNNEASQAASAYENSSTAQGGSDIGTLAALGTAYYAAGNKVKVITTFQKLVILLQQSKEPTLNSEASQYQAAIQRLQAGGSL